VSEMKEGELHICFYTGSLNYKATSSLSGQPEPGFYYIQKFYKLHIKITLLNKKTYSQKQQNLMVTLPSQSYMCSSS